VSISEDDAKKTASKIVTALERAATKTVLMLSSVKLLIGAAVYIILKNYVNQAAAELWMICLLGFAFFKYELLMSAVVKSELLKEMDDGDLEEEEDDEEEQKAE